MNAYFFCLILSTNFFEAIPITMSIKHIHAQEIFGIGLFLFAFFQQYDAHVRLANMRKGELKSLFLQPKTILNIILIFLLQYNGF